MFRKIAITAVAALTLGMGMAQAAGDGGHMEDTAFSWEGPFGKFDQFQLQRGLQVFTEVCSGCHGMKFVPIRSLADPGGPELPADQVRAYAASLDSVVLPDGTERPREWTDKFPTRSGEGMGPDLSLMAKARAGFHGPYGSGINQMFKGIGGPEYIVAILNGYADNPACAPDGIDGYYYNTAFTAGGIPESCKDEHGHATIAGSWIAMPPPVDDGSVEFADGHDNSKHHISEDVTAFLMWSAEPHMMARKQSGFVAVTFLILLSVLLYLTNKKLWARAKGKTFTA